MNRLKAIVLRAVEFFRGYRSAYQLTFSTPAGQMVLQDLAKFCRPTQTCFHPDPRLHAVAEGRREVWLRIQNYLNLTPEQLYGLLAKGPKLEDLSDA